MCSEITWLMSYSTDVKSGEEHQHCSLLHHPVLSTCHLLVGQQVAKPTILGISLNSPHPTPVIGGCVLPTGEVGQRGNSSTWSFNLAWKRDWQWGQHNIYCIFLLFKANWVSFNLTMRKSSYQAISEQDQCWRSINHSLFICKICIHSLFSKRGRQLSFPVIFLQQCFILLILSVYIKWSIVDPDCILTLPPSLTMALFSHHCLSKPEFGLLAICFPLSNTAHFGGIHLVHPRSSHAVRGFHLKALFKQRAVHYLCSHSKNKQGSNSNAEAAP